MEYMTTLYLMFVDFEKTFDSIYRNKMWELMNRYGIPWHKSSLVNCMVGVHEHTFKIFASPEKYFLNMGVDCRGSH
jgi:hypothetical protein